ncbi:cellulose biosynthesis cyclic di-GMP-binding regulatory protein BcsB [Lentilactobacillus sp. SPB1-3]|uniref:Cellulose biosynthesis cyclic di-GMP-binding regulatory protein BcsB n=1 Tax=Lentilactobacillus terminaliae TaxID=3003483 RepID=A0ACD5DGI2_9LACO|nr:cellulose biosynthesis cyclic di-GMP-binding regulatory protein BcsB [Lentilactobacillus sp. SPB1-3]
MNKSFINKPNGIKQNDISKLLALFIAVVMILLGGLTAQSAKGATSTYTEPFQNTTTSLSGSSVQTNMYFVKMGYWDVKKATFNLSFQISQLNDQKSSDITVMINGTKFYSFKPKNNSGIQNRQIEIPKKLISGTNNLQIMGQITNKNSNQAVSTPANWLTIYSGANVNFEYGLAPAKNSIKSFYDYFTGADTISNQSAVVATANKPDNNELTSSATALSGQARTITTADEELPIVTLNDKKYDQARYRMIVAKYDHLPDNLKKAVRRQGLDQKAVLQRVNDGDHNDLVVTSNNNELLTRAAKFVANSELMSETASDEKTVTDQTNTNTSVLQYQGRYQLTNQDVQLTGANHHEQAFFVNLPVDRTNANGSKIKINYKYAKNLDFNNSLITVYVNNQAIGSKKLTMQRANGDSVTVSLPKDKPLGNSFTIRVAFDLQLKKNADSNAETPWATVDSDSEADIKSEPQNDLLFKNYPSMFLKNGAFNNLAIVRPKDMTANDFKTFTNIVNLIGNYTQSNMGDLKVYDNKPSSSTLENANVVAFGTPDQNNLIKRLNSKLYFKFDNGFDHFLSNEKLSIESGYGHNIGTDQLIRSPYNKQRGMLIITAAKPEDVFIASTQISDQKNIQQYQNTDGILVDQDNNHYSYRFKKVAAINSQQNISHTISKNSQLLIYLGLAVFVATIIAVVGFMLLRKNGLLKIGDNKHE